MISIHIIYLSIYPASHLSIYLSFYHSLSIYFYLPFFFHPLFLSHFFTSNILLSPPLCKCIFLLSIQLFISLSLSFALFFISLPISSLLSLCFSPFPSDSLYLFLSFSLRPSLFVYLLSPPTLSLSPSLYL